MAPFIPDGAYKIRNVEFRACVPGLVNGIPFGPICGTTDRGGNVDELWHVVNEGFGGNQITIENAAARGCYASAKQLQGASLVGSRARTIWTVVKVDHGYYLQSPDANFVWELPYGGDRVTIVLARHTAKDNTKWTF